MPGRPPSPPWDDSQPPTERLARTLSLTQVVLYGLGITIGAGIYTLIGVAADRSGLHAPVAFLVAAAMMAFSAASFAELGTRFPSSAGEAVYVGAAFRRKSLMLAVGLLSAATSVVAAATISRACAGYLSVFIPLPPGWLVAGVVLAMGLIASRSAHVSVSFAGVLTAIEVGGLLIIVAAGLGNGETFARGPELLPGLFDLHIWRGIGTTALLTVFAFIGFDDIVNISEEIVDQKRTLPRALFITLGLSGLLYAAVAWTAVTAVPPEELARSPAPLALVFSRLTGLPLGVMSLIAITATLNGIIISMIVVARILYGLADRGHLPRFLARLHPASQAPVIATALAVAIILVLALTVPLDRLADITSTGALLIFAAVNMALIRIKARGDVAPPEAFICPAFVPYAGTATSLGLLVVDLIIR